MCPAIAAPPAPAAPWPSRTGNSRGGGPEYPHVPQMMRAVRLDEVGPPENLKLVERPIPEVGPDDVLIKVGMAGLIYGDTEARRGTYFSRTVTPWYPGREAAGFIEAVGANVTAWKPGERVVALILTL